MKVNYKLGAGLSGGSTVTNPSITLSSGATVTNSFGARNIAKAVQASVTNADVVYAVELELATTISESPTEQTIDLQSVEINVGETVAMSTFYYVQIVNGDTAAAVTVTGSDQILDEISGAGWVIPAGGTQCYYAPQGVTVDTDHHLLTFVSAGQTTGQSLVSVLIMGSK